MADPAETGAAALSGAQRRARRREAGEAGHGLNREAAYRRFQRQLLAGEIVAGQNLSQRELVEKLGISLGALRELLPRLESEGLLKVLPQRGIQITTIDLGMIKDSYQLRLAYEREATIHAVDHVPDEALRVQRALHLDIRNRARGPVPATLLDTAQAVDSGFHDFLIAATGNRLLQQAYSIVAIRVRLIRLDRVRIDATVLEPAIDDHLAIIDHLLARDRAAAVAAMETHILRARSRAVAL